MTGSEERARCWIEKPQARCWIRKPQEALFTELARTAESLLNRQAAEIERRQEWLAAAAEEQGDEGEEPAQQADARARVPSSADKYGPWGNEKKQPAGRDGALHPHAIK